MSVNTHRSRDLNHSEHTELCGLTCASRRCESIAQRNQPVLPCGGAAPRIRCVIIFTSLHGGLYDKHSLLVLSYQMLNLKKGEALHFSTMLLRERETLGTLSDHFCLYFFHHLVFCAPHTVLNFFWNVLPRVGLPAQRKNRAASCYEWGWPVSH